MTLPRPGEPAPRFDLSDGLGRRHTLEDYRGAWLLLYFYPRDFTPGCTRQACALRDTLDGLAAIVGVSLDPPGRHLAFAQRHRLPYPLLCDDGRTADAYGVLWRFGPWRWLARVSFLIDPEGRIREVYRRLPPAHHARRAAEALRAFTPR